MPRRFGVCLAVGGLLTALLPNGCVGASNDIPESNPDLEVEVGHGTVVQVEAASGEVTATLRVGPDPLLLTTAAGRVWTLNLGDGTLSRVDPSTQTVSQVDRGETVGIASDGAKLWVAVNGNKLVLIDGISGKPETEIELSGRQLFAPREAGFLGVGRESIWLTVPKLGRERLRQTLWRIDLQTKKVVAKIPLLRDPLSPLIDGRFVWLVSLTEDSVIRIDSHSNHTKRVAVGAVPVALAAGAGSVWVGHEVDQEVWRLDPQTAEPSAVIVVDDVVRGLAFGGGLLWVTTQTGLQAIDPETSEVVRRIELMDATPDAGPIGVAYLRGSVWVSVE